MANLARHILPIYVCPAPVPGEEVWPQRFVGTGFVLAPNVFVTCWHCVPPLPEGEVYAATAPDPEGGRSAHFLHGITQDPSGADLAMADIDIAEPPPFDVSPDPPAEAMGLDVGTLGYPGTFFELQGEGHRRFDEQPRYFQGYVTRAFRYRPPGGGPEIPSYELDMPAPGGLSGAPLITTAPAFRGHVVGVIYGVYPPFGSQGESGTGLPPYVFSLAHYHSTLVGLRGPITGNRSLAEILRPGT